MIEHTRTHTQTYPEPDDLGYEDFRIDSRHEVAGILGEIARRRVPLSLFYGDGAEFLVSGVVHVDAAAGTVLLDPPQDPARLAAVLAAPVLTCVAFVDQVKTQFATARVAATTFEGAPALRTALPASLLRLQRRNYFRVPVPKAAPITCDVPVADGAPARFEIGDLSVGGVAMLAGPARSDFTPGLVFHGCSIDLPGHGIISASLELRNTSAAAAPGAPTRYGCRFINLAGTIESRIQRYINDLERSRRNLL
jgi:c-di-GMP-binding flagellar brake protein YcgR